ncbi:MAG TPA: CoA pyrophosphatase [Dehalococcoidia bacterium]|nr:CoA pyrophosphatase [Dehalococcoidia bacterium]
MQITRDALGRYTPRQLDLAPGQMSSAVLVPLYVESSRYHILFTKRSDHVEHHKGQISFPGGAQDPDDPDLLHTALRETHEEIGVDPADVEVLGQLDDFVTITNFRVRPYVGLIRRSPYEFIYNRHEVAEVLVVPVSHLVDDRNIAEELRQVGERQVMMRSYVFEDHVIFGATAFMLRAFLDLLAEEGSIEELIREIAEEVR